jgi:hypothetical protein
VGFGGSQKPTAIGLCPVSRKKSMVETAFCGRTNSEKDDVASRLNVLVYSYVERFVIQL